MKKFNKCLFMIIAAVSTLLFTVYKLRYDRLYHVMQVLEVFGTPVDHSCEKKAPLPEIIAPSWVNIEPGLYAYSGHCVNLPGEKGACAQVDVLALMQDSVNTKDILCNLWIEGSAQPILGTFSHRILQEDKLYSSAVLSCQSKFTTKVPFGISFFRDKSRTGSLTVIPVSPVKEVTPSSSQPSSPILVCIQPTPVNTMLELSNILQESIAFHSLVGVSTMILYTNFLLHSVQNMAASLQTSRVQVLVYPWDVPSGTASNVQSSLLLQDCYEKSRLYSERYTLLTQNQVLMPETGNNLTQTLAGAVKQGQNSIPVRRFCSEYPNDKKSSHLVKPVSILQSTYYNKHLSGNATKLVHVRETSEASQNAQHKSPEQRLFINEYGPCNTFDFDETQKTAVYEPGALRFLDSLPTFLNTVQGL